MKVRVSRILTAVCAFFLIYMVVCAICMVELIIDVVSLPRITAPEFLFVFFLTIGDFFFVGVMFTCLCDSTCVVTIDENGVRNRNRFYEEYLAWEEIKDYGFLYGQGWSYKKIYFSGRRFTSKERQRLHKVALIRTESALELMWYPAVIRRKKNQKKKDIIIRMEYTDERWKYICSLAAHRKELLKKHLEELESGTGN